MPPIRRTDPEPGPSKEERLQTAKLEWEQGLHRSLRAAAIAHRVPHQTLSDRVNGRPSRKQAHESRQLLTKEQEDTLVARIEHFAATEKPLDKHGIYTLVYDMTGIIPGENWIYRFQKRYNDLRRSKPGNLDPKRAQDSNPTNIAGFYALVKQVYDDFPDVPPEHIWNMDEKGVQFGGGRKDWKKYFHLQSLKQSKFYRDHSDNLEMMTIIECVSPSGLTIPPTFVLSDGPKPVPSSDRLSGPIGAIATSPNGWTDNEIVAAWFTDSFIPYTNEHKVTNAPVVLFLDGHNSHELEAFREAAINNNIIVIAFPSKYTHKLQPLDIIVSALMQCHWSKHCDRRLYEDVKMDRYNIIEEYMSVRPMSMKPEMLRAAFSSTGIYPFNPDTFTEVDFAPAKSYSLAKHVPKSFPTEVPSSPNASDASDCETSSDDSETESEASEAQIDWATDSEDYEPPFSPPTPIALTTSTPDVFMQLPIVPPIPAVAPSAGMSSDTRGVQSPSLVATSHHFTRSQRASQHSSPAISVSVALDPTRAPVPESYEELKTEVIRLSIQCKLMQQEIDNIKSEVKASNAHCTITTREASTAKAALENQTRKTRHWVKTQASFVAYPGLEEQHDAQTLQKAQRAREAAEAKAQKPVEDALRETRIQEEIRTRTFSDPLSSYKRKDDLIALSGALGLNTNGTIHALLAQLRAHLDAHPEIQNNPRFSGLFLTNRQRRVENTIDSNN